MSASCLKLSCVVLLCTAVLQLHTASSKPSKPDFFKTGFPAIYAFGDSLFDAGNNNHLPGKIKSNFLPYGIDFEGGRPTGRYTNGKTVVDLVAEHHGLPLLPPYMGLSDSERSNTSTGINYASAGCGILPNFRKAERQCLSLSNQIELFRKTVQDDLPGRFRTQKLLRKHLSESLFPFNIGINDFLSKNEHLLDAEVFSQFLLDGFLMHLKKLYNLGARKFLVNNLPPAGCFPEAVHKMKPKGECNHHTNGVLSSYNTKLRNTLDHLRRQLPGSSFVYADLFNVLLQLRVTPQNYGISDTTRPCCPQHYNGTQGCERDSVACKARDAHMFFDQSHPSQIANYIYVERCLNEASVCTLL